MCRLLERAFFFGGTPRIRTASPAKQVQHDDALDVRQLNWTTVDLRNRSRTLEKKNYS